MIYTIFYFILYFFSMSLLVKNYKEVTRSFFNRVLLSNGSVGVTSSDRKKIQSELKDNKFFDENSHILWWRIHYNQYGQIIRIEPIFDE